jgi:ornithine carbamoyltransferase
MLKRDFLTVEDLSVAEVQHLLKRAVQLKKSRLRTKPLAGKVVALIFQKPSMRTRVSFEVAVDRLGGSVIYLGQDNIQLGQREPIKDVARVLSRYVDGIVVRMFDHAHVEELARYASVPVINGLSDATHPCQALADVLTILEHFGKVKGLKVAYVGDGNNVLHSLALACACLGVHVSAATPAQYRPDAQRWQRAVTAGKASGARLELMPDPQQAVVGADVIYTDVWTSMGQERERAQRLEAFEPYQVNERLLAAAARNAQVMHCLPAHRGEEITDGVIEGKQSLIFQQAENRLYAQLALLEMLLGPQIQRKKRKTRS